MTRQRKCGFAGRQTTRMLAWRCSGWRPLGGTLEMPSALPTIRGTKQWAFLSRTGDWVGSEAHFAVALSASLFCFQFFYVWAFLSLLVV